MLKAPAVKKLSAHTCKICGHSWQQRLDKEPKRCGKCKSPYWKDGYTYKKKG